MAIVTLRDAYDYFQERFPDTARSLGEFRSKLHEAGIAHYKDLDTERGEAFWNSLTDEWLVFSTLSNQEQEEEEYLLDGDEERIADA